MDVAGRDRWVWCPACRMVEFTHFIRCLCCNYEDRELVITIEVPAHLLERLDAACRLGGWDAAQAIANTWEDL